MEEERISAARHVLHLKALQQYQNENNLPVLTPADIEKFYEEVQVLENPDAKMNEINPMVAGPSNNVSLTSQSLSHHGFTDSSSEYLPSS
jgi:hypothetical protein